MAQDGKKKGGSMTEALREYLEGFEEVEVGTGEQKRTVKVGRKELFVQAMFKAATGGSVPAQQLLVDYLGTPVKPVKDRKNTGSGAPDGG